jgi:hypothetical protein
VYGTIQDGGGNGLVVLNPPERAEPNGAHDIIFIKIIQSPWKRRGTGQCMEQSKMVSGMDWLCSPRQRGLSLVGCPLSSVSNQLTRESGTKNPDVYHHLCHCCGPESAWIRIVLPDPDLAKYGKPESRLPIKVKNSSTKKFVKNPPPPPKKKN